MRNIVNQIDGILWLIKRATVKASKGVVMMLQLFFAAIDLIVCATGKLRQTIMQLAFISIAHNWAS